MPKKFIVVTGGVLSGIGKGIVAASISRLLIDCGIDVNVLKIDPYLNMDAGTMNPNQHGEVFVTDDGYEADLDLGHYERFTGKNMSRKNNLTAGQVYYSVITKERKGEYLGSTVQVVPHVTEEIKERIRSMEGELLVIEIGGTVGDIEGEVFLEAVRELSLELGQSNFLFIHTTFVPYLRTTNEFKTKPTQQSVQLLRRIGIHPNMIVVRTESPIDPASLDKISLFAGVPRNMVINLYDTNNVYEIPEVLKEYDVHQKIARFLNMELSGKLNWSYPKVFKPIKIALVGKYLGTDDAYKSIIESIFLCGAEKPRVIDSELLEESSDPEEFLRGFDGIIIPGGFGKRGIEGKIKAITYAREKNIPILGICLGMQLMVIEYFRNVVGFEKANSTEFDPDTPYPVIDIMEEQKKVLNLGGTMRLGSQDMRILPNTKLWNMYGEISEEKERHRHRYEVNYDDFKDYFFLPSVNSENPESKLIVSAMSDFVEAIELKNHPFFVGVQFHPEYKSKVGRPHPVFTALVKAIEEKLK
jgi:CTP synthase